MRKRTWAILTAAFTAAIPVVSADAAIVVNEPYTDGDLTAGADASGAAWFDRSANTTVSVVDDSAGIGSGNALQLAITASSQTDRPVLGVILSRSLEVTNSLTLSFDFRFVATPTTNTADGFRFGLYNSNGTAVTADNSTQSDDDFGYQTSIGTGTTPGLTLFKESANVGAGGAGTGADRNALTATGVSTFAVNDSLKHSAVFSITRTLSGVTLNATVDGVPRGTASDNASAFLTFDEILFSYSTVQNYRIDNVSLDYTVPEPTALAPLAIGFIGLLRRRARTRA